MYSQMMYCLDRVPVLAAQKPPPRDEEPFSAAQKRRRNSQSKPEGSLIQAMARDRCYSLFSRPIFYSVVDGSAVVAMESRSKARWRTVAA
jgi:hypothetical protein